MRNVAILGAGIGAQHLDGYLALPDRYHVAAICDLDLEKGRALAAKAPGCAAVSDMDAVIADPAIDIIDICLPPHLHGPVAVKAFAAGKPQSVAPDNFEHAPACVDDDGWARFIVE